MHWTRVELRCNFVKSIHTIYVVGKSLTSHSSHTISRTHPLFFCFEPDTVRADSHTSWVTSTLWEECTNIIKWSPRLCQNRTGCSPANKQLWFKDTVVLQEDFLQFGKVIHSLQVFYWVVISLQDLQVWQSQLITLWCRQFASFLL